MTHYESASKVGDPAAQGPPAAHSSVVQGAPSALPHMLKPHGWLMFPSLVFDHHSELETKPPESSGEAGWNFRLQ